MPKRPVSGITKIVSGKCVLRCGGKGSVISSPYMGFGPAPCGAASALSIGARAIHRDDQGVFVIQPAQRAYPANAIF
jgi:hypothetical protein